MNLLLHGKGVSIQRKKITLKRIAGWNVHHESHESMFKMYLFTFEIVPTMFVYLKVLERPRIRSHWVVQASKLVLIP